MNKLNEKTIEKFKDFRLNIENCKNSTLTPEIFTLSALAKKLGNKTFKNATEQEIIDSLKEYKDTTRNNRIIVLKKFYRWLNNLEKGEKLPNCVRRIKRSSKSALDKYKDMNYRERIVTETEYNTLIDNSNKIMHKAVIETLYLFGCRASELISMNSNDVTYDGKVTKINIRLSKEIPRPSVYQGRAEHLLKWAETYQPFKGQKNKPLWTIGKTRYTRISLEKAITSISKRAGLRHITPHDFRHTAVTRERAKGTPTAHIETNFGYRHGSPMMGVYDHNETKDYETYLEQKNKETPATYELLKKQKETIEQKHKKEIDNLKTALFELAKIISKPEITVTVNKKDSTDKTIDNPFSNHPKLKQALDNLIEMEKKDMGIKEEKPNPQLA
jgi:integrase